MTRLEEIEVRLSAIKTDLEAEGADIEALTAETDKLLEERTAIKAEMEARTATLAKIAELPIEKENTKMEERKFDASSAEYRSAFLKNLMGESLTEVEERAYLHTTQNTSAVLPTTMLDKIWDLVSTEHVIMGDITIYKTGTVIEVVKHTAIVNGKAKKVAQGVANDDEENTFVKITLAGNDFSKTVRLSYALAKMSLDAFEAYIINEIAASLGEELANDVVASIGTGMNSANKLTNATPGTATYEDFAGALGALKRVQNATIYANRSSIYKWLVGMVDTTGRPIFQPSAQAGVQGTFIGATIKVEDSIAADTFLIGDPKKVVYNMVQDIMVESAKDIDTHKIIYSGYARGEGALIDDMAFSQLTIA